MGVGSRGAGKDAGVVRHIVASFAAYDLSRIDVDLLKQLYQNLVGPETRHELGEFYTPDWLAELTLREIGYDGKRSLLDPACGSGAFLFSAIRRLAAHGVTGTELVDFALDNIMGMDVHPLAVTIAKINYMLALLPHIQQGGGERGQRSIPIALSNSLQMPSKAHPVSVIEIPFDVNRSFKIPTAAAKAPQKLNEVLREMERWALEMARNPQSNMTDADFAKNAVARLPSSGEGWSNEAVERAVWAENLRALRELIQSGRDTIWAYVLENTSRPQILQYRKFDVVVGNPPWIAYRYLQDSRYQEDVKGLARDYGLADSRAVKLNTQLELSTLFFEHCWRTYLKGGGTLAFVMPRSVITGAKQHQAFQQTGFTRVIDLKGVSPLFNVETCVLIREGFTLRREDIPTLRVDGRLQHHECLLTDAEPCFAFQQTVTNFVDQIQVASPYYYPKFKQGATLVPRNLVYVTSAQPNLQSGQMAQTSIMRTDPELDAEAKAPWKGLKHEGHIDEMFLYATLLSKNVVPFGVRKLKLVALPVRVGLPSHISETIDPGLRFFPVSLAEMREAIEIPGVRDPGSVARSAEDWFEPAESLWHRHKKESVKETLAEWLNYQNKLTSQSAEPGTIVLFGASGSNISATVVDTSRLSITNGAHPKAFVIDYTSFGYRCHPQEAHFLCAVLNAPCVDAAIKPHQPRGIYVGPRHIQRRPFEVVPIPQFNSDNLDHRLLAELSQEAHAVVATLNLTEGGVVAARKRAREAVRPLIERMDTIAQRLLGLAPANATMESDEEEGDEDVLTGA